MKYLAICIPNYNRLEKLKRLIEKAVFQIRNHFLEAEVEICVSDDCSVEDPSEVIAQMQKKYSDISFHYVRNEVNKGMDYNFLNSVLISDSLYCWIMGNDDLPEEDGIYYAIKYLKSKKEQVDILITPFNVYGEDGEYRNTIYPFGSSVNRTLIYDTKNLQEYDDFINGVQHNSALFGFLSNIIFKRQNWDRYKIRFQDKLDTIFIQMYMNLQTLQDGARVEYVPEKIIRSYSDDETNESIERIGKILLGLNGVIDYFFDGASWEYLHRMVVDDYINQRIWNLPEENPFKQAVRKIQSKKNECYQKYFVPANQRKEFFFGKEVFVFGAGKLGELALKELEQYKTKQIIMIDSNMARVGEEVCGRKIQSKNVLKDLYHNDSAVIVITAGRYMDEMVEELLEKKVTNIAIIT